MPNLSAVVHLLLALLLLNVGALARTVVARQAIGAYPAPNNNDFSCRSAAHPNPVVLLHGLGATYYEDLNVLETNLEQNGFCTFAITYGAYPFWPFVGGLQPIADSAQMLAAFIKQVQTATGASKVDLVGHSEGAFQALYVPKFEPGIASIVDNIVAIAPPTHGTTVANLYDFAYVGGNLTRQITAEILDIVGCPACNDLGPNGPAVQRLNDGNPIKQPGNDMLIIISTHDELVTPVQTAQVNEPGVRNVYIQTRCPNDPVGHIGEAYDQNVWALVKHALDPRIPIPSTCATGLPY